ncbi:hypothetical protein Agabi119p4_6277 [Agaricus bisporus var. burnettii]|uniref:Uncharacterized protein n=1 Tax=Agaricus bisporus var. burnettii TaxID=192524 RepID=A0A8H7F016_AGABI|nr:hypothetical protein Agabi119p4_6277 [Agaricus bisporus var. burnettii]
MLGKDQVYESVAEGTTRASARQPQRFAILPHSTLSPHSLKPTLSFFISRDDSISFLSHRRLGIFFPGSRGR